MKTDDLTLAEFDARNAAARAYLARKQSARIGKSDNLFYAFELAACAAFAVCGILLISQGATRDGLVSLFSAAALAGIFTWRHFDR